MIDAKLYNTEAVYRRIKGAADKIGKAIEKSIKQSTFELAAYIQMQKLSGQAVGVVTGRLRNSIQPPKFKGSGKDTVGVIAPNNIDGSPVKYAAAIEFGFDKTVDVKKHERMMTTAFGKPVPDPRMISVRAHTMKMNVLERPFMRPSLSENRTKIAGNIRTAIMEVISE